jgi:hypothetical protein
MITITKHAIERYQHRIAPLAPAEIIAQLEREAQRFQPYYEVGRVFHLSLYPSGYKLVLVKQGDVVAVVTVVEIRKGVARHEEDELG